MKKIKYAVLTVAMGCMVLLLSGCFGSNTAAALPALVLPTAEAASGVSSGEETAVDLEPVKDEDCDDDLAGLGKFLLGNYGIAGEAETMSFEVIGAKDGCRYQFTFEGKSMQVELYEFDLLAIDDEVKGKLEQAKESGSMTILNNEVDVTVSENGKYLMIYINGDKAEAFQTQQERVETMFRGFYA